MQDKTVLNNTINKYNINSSVIAAERFIAALVILRRETIYHQRNIKINYNNCYEFIMYPMPLIWIVCFVVLLLYNDDAL